MMLAPDVQEAEGRAQQEVKGLSAYGMWAGLPGSIPGQRDNVTYSYL